MLWTDPRGGLQEMSTNGDILMQFIASKTQAALDGGLGVILCVGETLEVRNFSVAFEGCAD